MTPKPGTISDTLIHTICERLAADKPVRRSLPGSGRIHIDRQLPFLCVYRTTPNRPDDGTRRLVMGEASYLIAPGDRSARGRIGVLIRKVVRTLSGEFGTFLVVEVWAGGEEAEQEVDAVAPAFSVVHRGGETPTGTLDTLQHALQEIRIRRKQAEVTVRTGGKTGPPGLPSLLTPAELRDLNCHLIGVEVRPIYRDAKTGKTYPLVRRVLHRELTRAFLRTFYQFVRAETTHQPRHYHALGRRAVVKAVWEVDRKLADVSAAFPLLLQVSPINPDSAWHAFQRRRFERSPTFIYRPREFDPALLKRKLWEIPIERIEDPTLADLFREKRSELDTQLGMLADLDTSRFLPGSLQVFGRPDRGLVRLARALLDGIPPRAREDGGKTLGAEAFAEQARSELAHYQRGYPSLTAQVFVRPDLAGLMVFRGNLLVGQSTAVPKARVDALLQHELGTHVLTYFNGRAQPLRLLSIGLAGYEELQEGLAVLAEYLVGGLSRPRLRLLAGRVLAAHALVEGANFVEVFRALNREWSFSQRTAFVITMRIFRGGGFTKDMVYLKGLVSLLDYLKRGGEFDPLLVGKIAVDHIPVIHELQLRGVLRPAPLTPRYLERPETATRLDRVRSGLEVMDLVKGKTQ